MSNNNSSSELKIRIYQILKNRIINCVYPPGSLLNESALAAELDLSRTPIREAIYRLEQDGLVQVMPKKGIYIPDITLQDILYVFQTRTEIEPLALKLAAPYLKKSDLERYLSIYSEDEPDMEKAFWQDMDMHTYFTDHCGNPFIMDMMHKVYDQSCKIVIASKQNKSKIQDARLEHTYILKFLLDEEYDKACLQLRKHLESCKNYSLNYYSATYNQASSDKWTTGNELYLDKAKQ